MSETCPVRCSRRELLGMAAAAAWAAKRESRGSPPKPNDLAPNAFRLRYILASSLFGKMRLEEVVPEVRKTGTEWLDIWPEVHANHREQMDALGRDRFAALLARHGARLGMTTRYDLGPFRLREEIKVVRDLGGSLIVTGSQGPRGLVGDECKRAVGAFIEKMKPHVAAAEEAGVTIAIENHAHALVASIDSLRYFAEFAKSPRLGIALAPYHLPQDPSLLARLIEDLGPKVVHFYAWQEGRGCFQKLPKDEELEQLPGRGKLDFRPILAALRKIGYSGWTEIFMHPVPRGVPILPTPSEITNEINRARAYLDQAVSAL